MSQKAYLPLLLLGVILSGCAATRSPSTTESVNNQNSINQIDGTTNTDNLIVNQTNTEDTVDTSEWLSYHSDEFNFSFKYPADWGEVSSKNYSPSDNIAGHRTLLLFSSTNSQNTTISIESLDYKFVGVSDGMELDFNAINTDLSDEELARNLKRFEDSNLIIHKTQLLGRAAVEVTETYMSLGDKQEYTYVLIPDYNGYNIRIASSSAITPEIKALAESLESI